MNIDDISADVEMSFRQIISITDLMFEYSSGITPNILTIRDLAQAGLDKVLKINN